MSEKLLDVAKRRYKLAQESFALQERGELEDLRFQVPELQWTPEARREREGIPGGVMGVPVPARPILSIPKLDQPMSLVKNQMTAAHLGVNIHPVSEEADDDTAEVLQGLYRSIEQDRDYPGRTARAWAFDRAVDCGRGYYRIRTVYDEASGDPWDQKIVIDRILNQGSVYFDPSAERPDFSDAEWAFVASWVPRERFKREFGKSKSKLAEYSSSEWQNLAQSEPNWVKGDGDEQAVLVAEYFYKRYEYEELTAPEEGEVGERKRTREKCVVCVAKICSDTVLEDVETDGQYIPLVFVPGRELQVFESRRRWVGMIGPAKDAQRLYNYAASAAVEMAALEPRAPWLLAEGQTQGYESLWQQTNTRNFPYLVYRATTIGDQPAPPPARVQVDVSRLGPSMMLLQSADNFIQSATATFDPALGRLQGKERSGRAIQALQDQADAGNSNFIQALVDISMVYEAKVILDLIPKVYDRPGRVVRILGLEDDPREVVLNAPFVVDPRTGRPKRLNGQVLPGVKPKHYDLSNPNASYGVRVAIGKSYQSRLQQGADEIGQILQSRPELMPLLGPVYFRFRDFPGAREIAELLKRVRDKQFPGLDKAEGEGASPEQLEAQLAQAGQQVQMLQQQLQKAVEYIKTEEAKQQAMLQKAAMDNQSKVAIEQLRAENKIMIARMEAMIDAVKTGQEHKHDEEMAAAQHGHERAMGAAEAGAAQAQAEIAALLKPQPSAQGDGDLGSDFEGGGL